MKLTEITAKEYEVNLITSIDKEYKELRQLS